MAAIVGLLAYINLILATFNMIPGLPLDGGNVLKAIIWKITGNRYLGIRWASRSGQVFAYLATALGLLSVLGISNVGSFWTLIVGWFLLQNARQAGRSAVFQESLSGLTTADAVLRESPIIHVDSTLTELADLAIFSSNRSRWQRFLVKDANDQLIGAVNLNSLKGIPSEQWSNYQVRNFLKPLDQGTQIQADQSLLEAISQFEKQGSQALVVIQENGTLVGLLEKAHVLNLLGQRMRTKQA
jgi:predicted transcriptional regulator